MKLVVSIVLATFLFASTNINNKYQNLLEQDIGRYSKVTLLDVVYEALSNNQKLKADREKVIQAKLKIDDAKGGFLPIVNFIYKTSTNKKRTFGVTKIVNGEERFVNENKKFMDISYKLSLKQSLYAGGETVNKVKSLRESYIVSKNKYILNIKKFIEKVIKNYYDVVFNRESINFNRANFKMLSKILAIVEKKYKSGALGIGELSAIKANIANANSKLSNVQAKFIESYKYYDFLVGSTFQYTVPFENVFSLSLPTVEEIVELSLKNNISLKSYYNNIASQKYKAKAANSKFKPLVDLEFSSKKTPKQEDFEASNEQINRAVLSISYNIFNRNKDKTSFLKNISLIKELMYNLEEEKKKLKWNITRAYHSIISTASVIESNKNEAKETKTVVDSYWKKFKLGDQDLQMLLQAQRQLKNTELELIKNKRNVISSYFKLLSSSGKLMEYFNFDIDNPNFIDFSNSTFNYKQINKKVLSNNATINLDIKISTNCTNNCTNISGEKTSGLEEINKFKNKFMSHSDKAYTIAISKFSSIYDALGFIVKQNLQEDAFAYEYPKSDKLVSNIAYGIFKSKEEASTVMEDLNNTKTKKIYRIEDILNSINKKRVVVKTKNILRIEKVKVGLIKKVFKTDEVFKGKFLNANYGAYSINLATFSDIDKAGKFVNDNNLTSKTFVFTFGDNSEWVKVMYGVYDNYEDAKIEMIYLKDNFVENNQADIYPSIEKIGKKQDLYSKYKNVDINSSINFDDYVEVVLSKTSETKINGNTTAPDLLDINKTMQENMHNDLVANEKENEFEKYRLTKKSVKTISKEFFTVNLAVFKSEKSAQRFITDNNFNNNALIHISGDYIQVIYGLFSNKNEALNCILRMSKKIQSNKPTPVKLLSKFNDFGNDFLDLILTSNMEKNIDTNYQSNDTEFSDEILESQPILEKNLIVNKNYENIDEITEVTKIVESGTQYKEVEKLNLDIKEEGSTSIPVEEIEITTIPLSISTGKILNLDAIKPIIDGNQDNINLDMILDKNKVKSYKVKESNITSVIKLGTSKIKKYRTTFKNKLLSMNNQYGYIIDLETFSSYERAVNFIKNSSLEDMTIIHKAGIKLNYYKVVYGIFKTKDKATEVVNRLLSTISDKPIVKKLSKKFDYYGNKFLDLIL